MGSILDWNGKPNVPEALRCGDGEARTGPVRAALEPGRIAKASKRVARPCPAHFENDEQSRESAELAYKLRVREMDDDEVIYPTVVQTGGYL